MKIIRIKNNPVPSNCFVIHHDNGENCIIIDPGSEDTKYIEKELCNKKVDFIILTHEHFDHIWGADKIRARYNTKIYCSENTSNAIVNRKKNLSIFYNQIGFELQPADFILQDGQCIDWDGIKLTTIVTPGHSAGSICIKCAKDIFTGDTIINRIRTVTKLPGGSETDLQKSMKKLAEIDIDSLKLFCGHGE